MPSIRGVLVDLSGTLHVEDSVLPGCAAALSKLLAHPDISVRFVTNTTTKSRRELIQQLHRIGLDNIDAEHVLTSGGIACSLLEQRNLRPLLLVDPSLEEEFNGLDRTNPNAVVVGLAPEHFHYDKLNEAFRVLLDGGSLIALHEANIAPAEAVMIGDDFRQDVHGAIELGMRGVLVRTGKYRSGDEAKINPPPSHVATGFPNAVEWVLQRNSPVERSGLILSCLAEEDISPDIVFGIAIFG